MVWGEGHNYIGGPSNPGHVIFRRLREPAAIIKRP
jgi:hypothetical protein